MWMLDKGGKLVFGAGSVAAKDQWIVANPSGGWTWRLHGLGGVESMLESAVDKIEHSYGFPKRPEGEPMLITLAAFEAKKWASATLPGVYITFTALGAWDSNGTDVFCGGGLRIISFDRKRALMIGDNSAFYALPVDEGSVVEVRIWKS